jgi:hypothetical protein
VNPYSHEIILNWTNPSGSGSCINKYVIEWKAITYENDIQSVIIQEKFYIIQGLNACKIYEVSVEAKNVNNDSSGAEVKNVTTLTDGKWLLICRSMACTYATPKK